MFLLSAFLYIQIFIYMCACTCLAARLTLALALASFESFSDFGRWRSTYMHGLLMARWWVNSVRINLLMLRPWVLSLFRMWFWGNPCTGAYTPKLAGADLSISKNMGFLLCPWLQQITHKRLWFWAVCRWRPTGESTFATGVQQPCIGQLWIRFDCSSRARDDNHTSDTSNRRFPSWIPMRNIKLSLSEVMSVYC